MLPLVRKGNEARRAMPPSTREQCLLRAEECGRLAAESKNAHLREPMLFLAGRWRAFAAAVVTRVPPASGELRDEARHMRVLALEVVTDDVMLRELQALIDELEARALGADGTE